MKAPTLEKDWTTAAGLRAICLIINLDNGPYHRCGYVGVPLASSYYMQHYYNLDLDVHGGLTYSGRKLLTDNNDLWWLGFDCTHAEGGEITQDYSVSYIRINYPARSLAYVEAECEKLAMQLRKYHYEKYP